MFYLRTPQVASNMQGQMIGWLVNNDLENVQKDAVLSLTFWRRNFTFKF